MRFAQLATAWGVYGSSERSRCRLGHSQDARLAGPALVEHREAVAAQRGVQRDRERRGRRHRRLSRAAGQRDQELARAVALDRVVQRDRPRRGARAVERHGERGAAELLLTAARLQRRRGPCRPRCQGGHGAESESGEESGTQGPATVHGSTQGRIHFGRLDLEISRFRNTVGEPWPVGRGRRSGRGAWLSNPLWHASGADWAALRRSSPS